MKEPQRAVDLLTKLETMHQSVVHVSLTLPEWDLLLSMVRREAVRIGLEEQHADAL